MSETVILHNKHKTMSKEIFAFDGDSIEIMPDAKPEVDVKFLWKLPEGVVEFKPKHTVFGKKTKEVHSKKAAKENSVSVETARNTVKTS